MLWKALLVACMAVGVFAEYKLNDQQREQVKQILRDTCKNHGNEDKVEAVETTIMNFAECVKSLIDPETLSKEIEAAKPNGELDEVFKKYCAKSPQLKTCIHTLTNGISPCFGAHMDDAITYTNNSTDQLIDFVCYKDGDRIALFIAESGPQCIQAKMLPIRECFTKASKGMKSIDDFRNLGLVSQCAKMDELFSCMVTALEECDTPTPGNMAEALFRYIRNGTPCKEL